MTMTWVHCRTPTVSRILLLAMSAIALGCGPSSERKSREPSRTGPFQSASQQSDAAMPADRSLSTEEYRKLGVPAPELAWSADDLLKVAKALEKLAEKDFQQLPRYESNRSGKVFARMTSADNLEQIKQSTLHLKVRLQQGLAFLLSYRQLLQLYLSAFAKKAVSDFELVEIEGATLRVIALVLQTAEELLATINKDDPSYEQHREDLQRMRRGAAEIVAGCLQCFTDRQDFHPATLANLVVHLRATLPAIAPRLPPRSKDECLTKLRMLAKEPNLKDSLPGLEELYASVEKALKKKD